MGVDIVAYVGYGFVMTYQEARKLVSSLSDMSEDEVDYEDIDECLVNGEISLDILNYYTSDSDMVVYSSSDSLVVEPGEYEYLSELKALGARSRVLLGLAERIGKEPRWLAWSVCS